MQYIISLYREEYDRWIVDQVSHYPVYSAKQAGAYIVHIEKQQIFSLHYTNMPMLYAAICKGFKNGVFR